MMELIARIRKAGNMIQIIPAYVDLLASTLSYTRRIQEGGNAADVTYIKVELYDVRRDAHGQEFLMAPAGLLARVIRTFKAYNIRYEIEELRPRAELEPDWSRMDAPRPGQDIIMAKVANIDRGQIEAPTGDGKTWIIVQVCKVYHKANIVIAVPGISEAKNIVDRLRAEFPITDVGQVGGGKKEIGRRVTVAVRNSLMKVDLPATDILIYDECHTAGAEKTSAALSYATDCKMIGFSATTEMRSDGSDMEVEALFGPVVHVTKYEESQDRGSVVPIKAVFRPVRDGPVILSNQTDVINRQGLWLNSHRNNLAAADARLYADRGKQVMVFVKTVRHGLEMLERLPDFVFVYGSMDKALRRQYERAGVINPGEHPISLKDREQFQEMFENGQLRKVITTCWHTGVNFPQLEVIVRVDGTSNSTLTYQLGGRLSRTYPGKEHGLLIDYFDMWHETMHGRSLKRARDCAKKGWDVSKPKSLNRRQEDANTRRY